MYLRALVCVACMLSLTFGTQERPTYNNTLGLGYLHSHMQNNDFSITSQGVSLHYTAKNTAFQGFYQLNLTQSNLHPKTSQTPQSAQNIGFFSAFDLAFSQSALGYHLIGIEGGVNFRIPSVRKNQFDELSLMLNLDYGYVFEFENLALYPYVRIEQYLFVPYRHLWRFGGADSLHDPNDYGLNFFLGGKLLGRIETFKWWLNLGAMSDFNLSGNGVGILGDHSIVYDRDGISNGLLCEFGADAINYKRLSLQMRFSASYALSYYELNLKSWLALVLDF